MVEKTQNISIPIDLIFEIFLRLPVKSIVRCRCLSKLWATTICRQDFTKSFLTRSCARPQLLFAYKNNKELVFFSLPQPQSPDANSPPLKTNHLARFSFDDWCEIFGPVHGLVCVTNRRRSEETVLMICNPSTGQVLTLPKVKKESWMCKDNLYFGYNPIDNQYKVLFTTWLTNEEGMVTDMEHQILTLGTGKLSWRPVECSLPHYTPYQGICINGVLYYKATDQSPIINRIVRFDLRSEKFSFINVMQTLRLDHGKLVNYNEKLGLLLSGMDSYVNARSTGIELWVLEDVEKQEWSEHRYVLPALWWYRVGTTSSLRFVGITRTKEIVLQSVGWEQAMPFSVLYYNTERKQFTRVDIQEIEAFKLAYVYTDYIETLPYNY